MFTVLQYLCSKVIFKILSLVVEISGKQHYISTELNASEAFPITAIDYNWDQIIVIAMDHLMATNESLLIKIYY